MKKWLIVLPFIAFATAPAMAQAPEKPLVSFGVFADPQYDRDTTTGVHGRRYHLATARLSEAIDTFNSRDDLAFTVSLGDIIDRNYKCFADLVPVLAKSRVPIHYAYGNHDYVRPFNGKEQKEFFRMVGRDDSPYSFVAGGVRFIMMNSNEIALYSSEEGSASWKTAKAIFDEASEKHLKYARKYNGSASERQLKWLERQLRSAGRRGQKAVILTHQPLSPENGKCLLINHKDVLEIIRRHGSTVIAHLSGHEHDGGFEQFGSTALITFQGMCEGRDNRYAIVSIYPNRLEIQGFGSEPSRNIPFLSGLNVRIFSFGK